MESSFTIIHQKCFFSLNCLKSTFLPLLICKYPVIDCQPLSPLDMAGDLEYADMDFRSYGPINYKAASIYAMVKKNKGGALQEVKK